MRIKSNKMAKTHRYYRVELRKAGADRSNEMWMVWFQSGTKDSTTVTITILEGEEIELLTWKRKKAEEFYSELMILGNGDWYISKKIDPDAVSKDAMSDATSNRNQGLGLIDTVDWRGSSPQEKKRQDKKTFTNTFKN